MGKHRSPINDDGHQPGRPIPPPLEESRTPGGGQGSGGQQDEGGGRGSGNQQDEGQ